MGVFGLLKGGVVLLGTASGCFVTPWCRRAFFLWILWRTGGWKLHKNVRALITLATQTFLKVRVNLMLKFLVVLISRHVLYPLLTLSYFTFLYLSDGFSNRLQIENQECKVHTLSVQLKVKVVYFSILGFNHPDK